jgi:hypothetical protein
MHPNSIKKKKKRETVVPATWGSVHRRIAAKAMPGINVRPYVKSKESKKGLRGWLEPP